MTPEDRLKTLGLELPPAPAPVGSYVPVIQVGDLVYTSGQIPMRGGKLVASGKVGSTLSIEQAGEAARVAVLNALAHTASAAGGLNNIVRIVRLGVYVNSSKGFTDQAKVANAASDLLVQIFADAGRHVRAAVGAGELPLDSPVEIEMTAQVSKRSGQAGQSHNYI
ncbi:MAG: RidA family protein [Planctomycetota bacterium]|nr:MAG: RidA family protein [Planctomycetota bacterium]